MRFKTPFLYLVLLSLSLSAAALTLGRARGAAWIGMPLDLAIAVQMESEQQTGGLCAEADVFYADTKIESARVQVSVEAGTTTDGATVRVRSSVPIDEPVVTVYVRAGCTAKSTRRFVLLADYPTESSPTAVPSRPVEPAHPVETIEPTPVAAATTTSGAPNASNSQSHTTPTTSVAPQNSAQSTSRPARPAPPPKAEKPAPAKATATRKSEPDAKPIKPSGNGGARLKLDPLENLTERVKSLEATTTSPPAQEMAQDTTRIAQLQGDLKALLEQAAKNEASLAAMRERLEKAESEQQIPAVLIYVLVALIAVCVIAIYVLWTRRTPGLSLQGQTTPTAPPIKPYQVPSTEHVDLEDISFESAVAVIEPKKVVTSQHFDFNAQRMLDLCQQAIFMQSVGKTNEAIALLEKRIRINAHDCPLVYLQLLDILNESGRNTDYRVVRDGFMQRFSCNVPEFSSFRAESKTLDAYPGTLSHITQLWNSPQAIAEIESTVIRQAQEAHAPRFDLAAFRELLMLHGVACAATEPQRDAYPPAADSEHINLDL